jgi:hypothetical protein
MTFRIVLGETLAKHHPGADLYVDRWLPTYGPEMLAGLGGGRVVDGPTDPRLLPILNAILDVDVRILTNLQGRASIAAVGMIVNHLRDRGRDVTIDIETLPEAIRAFSGSPRVEYRPALETRPATAAPLRVFLCHSSGDKDRARQVYRALQKQGAEVWFDEASLIPGEEWHAEIEKAVRGSHLVVVCLSRAAVDKVGFVQREIRLALDAAEEQPESTIFIVPLKLEDCVVPKRLARWQWLSMEARNWEDQLARTLAKRAADLRDSAAHGA